MPNHAGVDEERYVSRRVTLQQLEKYYDRPLLDVAKAIGISITMLKKICRKFGIQRWPHRQIRSITKTMEALEEKAKTATPQEARDITRQVEMMRKKRRIVARGASSGLQPSLRNAIFLANPEDIEEDQLFEQGILPRLQEALAPLDRIKANPLTEIISMVREVDGYPPMMHTSGLPMSREASVPLNPNSAGVEGRRLAGNLMLAPSSASSAAFHGTPRGEGAAAQESPTSLLGTLSFSLNDGQGTYNSEYLSGEGRGGGGAGRAAAAATAAGSGPRRRRRHPHSHMGVVAYGRDAGEAASDNHGMGSFATVRDGPGGNLQDLLERDMPGPEGGVGHDPGARSQQRRWGGGAWDYRGLARGGPWATAAILRPL